MGVRLRIGRIKEVRKISRIGHIVDRELRRKKHGGKSEYRA